MVFNRHKIVYDVYISCRQRNQRLSAPCAIYKNIIGTNRTAYTNKYNITFSGGLTCESSVGVCVCLFYDYVHTRVPMLFRQCLNIDQRARPGHAITTKEAHETRTLGARAYFCIVFCVLIVCAHRLRVCVLHSFHARARGECARWCNEFIEVITIK